MVHSNRFILRKLAFTGPRSPEEGVGVQRRIESHLGRIETQGSHSPSRPLDFMMGRRFAAAQHKRSVRGTIVAGLSSTCRRQGRVTLARALSGGGLRAFISAPSSPGTDAKPDRTLAAAHADEKLRNPKSLCGFFT